MKVIVAYENSFEKGLADNLVKVLKTIGGMLVYGKVTNAGVMLEDWASKPKVNLECTAIPTGAAAGAATVSAVPYVVRRRHEGARQARTTTGENQSAQAEYNQDRCHNPCHRHRRRPRRRMKMLMHQCDSCKTTVRDRNGNRPIGWTRISLEEPGGFGASSNRIYELCDECSKMPMTFGTLTINIILGGG